MKKATVVGAAGYVGGEVCRLLVNHPEVDLVCAQSNSSSPKPLWAVHEDMFGDTDLTFAADVDTDVDVIFLCSGHGKSRQFLEQHTISPSTLIIDLGNDFRLENDSQVADRKFVYGLSDTFSHEISNSLSIANPGCFATAIQLGILPMANAAELIDDIHITATTGSTGAGQKPSSTTHFSWRSNNLSTYKTFSHQHLGEISQSISRLQRGFNANINFVPYRGDFPRGIIATIHTKTEMPLEQIRNIYKEYYKNSRFTFVSDNPINLKQVVNTNKSIIHIEKHGEYMLVTTVIDNLLRGAAGQAIENMNLVFDLPLDSGLKLKPLAF